MAGRIPKSFIDDLLLRTDIVDVIDARVPLKKAGKDHKACCPFHEEKTPSFTVSSDKQFYHCFGCGAHGTAIGFLMEYEHMSFPEAVAELAARAGLPLPQEARDAPPAGDGGADLVAVLTDAASFYCGQLRSHPQAPRAVDYLKRRGITGEIAQSFGLGFAPEGWDSLLRALGQGGARQELLVRAGLAVKKESGGCYDRFRDRVMFPIHDYRGRIVGFGGRVIDQGEPKYLNSPETPVFHKGRELYGLFRAREAIKRDGRALVVEGYMDVVALAQCGIDIAVATLGTAATRDHLQRLFRFAPELVFCFDGDRAGHDAAWRALDVTLPFLGEGRQASFMFVPEGEDPDTLVRKEGRESFLGRIKSAMAVPDFLFKGLAKQVDLGRQDGRARLAELARPYLSKVPPGVLRDSMLDRLNLQPGERNKLAELVGGAERAGVSVGIRQPVGNRPQPASPERLAVALLLQHPRLAAQAPPVGVLAALEGPGVALLRELLQLLQVQPTLNTGAIVERFRGTEAHAHLAKLAAWEHPALAHDVEAEFAGALRQLERAAAKNRADRLLHKQRVEGLSEQEKAELARILSSRGRETAPFSPKH